MTKLEFGPLEKDDDPEDRYPPKGTPETAIVINLDEDAYSILHHTGRYFHGQLVVAGLIGEEIGIMDVPTDPGVWTFEDGKYWTHTDWETGIVDDYGISGSWRKATPDDFANAGIECPIDIGD